MPDTGDAARAARPRHPGAVLRLGPASERARRAGTGGREPEQPRRARARQGRQGAHRPVQPIDGGGARAWLMDREEIVRGRTRGLRAARERRGSRKSPAHESAEPLFLNYRGGRLSTRSVDRLVRQVRRGVQRALRDQPARAAAFVRDAPARTRRRPARHPGAARPRAPEHDAALHARQLRPADSTPTGRPIRKRRACMSFANADQRAGNRQRRNLNQRMHFSSRSSPSSAGARRASNRSRAS